MMSDALAEGATVYDLRGITDTLDPDDPHVGLIQFKVGTGGEAVEYVGEWDLPLNKALYTAFDLYMREALTCPSSCTSTRTRWREHLRDTWTDRARTCCQGQRLWVRPGPVAGRGGCTRRAEPLRWAPMRRCPRVAGFDVVVLSPWRPFLDVPASTG